MAQVTIYLPEDLEARLRREARRAGKSFSSYIADLVGRRGRPHRKWPAAFLATFGSWEGELKRPEQLPLDEPGGL